MFPFALHKVCTRLSYSPIPNSLPQLLYNFPIMNLKMDYGRHGLNLTLPDSAEVFLARDSAPFADEADAIRDVLRKKQLNFFASVKCMAGL
jgi:hypothetical protein